MCLLTVIVFFANSRVSSVPSKKRKLEREEVSGPTDSSKSFRDIRLSYMRLLVDAINTANTRHFKNLCVRFFHEQVNYREQFDRETGPSQTNGRQCVSSFPFGMYQQLALSGSKHFGAYWSLLFGTALPDVVVELHRSELMSVDEYLETAENETTSRWQQYAVCADEDLLVSSFTVSGTKLFHVLPDPRQFQRQGDRYLWKTSPSDDTQSDKIMNDAFTLFPVGELKDVLARDVRLHGEAVFSLNGQGQVTHVEVTWRYA